MPSALPIRSDRDAAELRRLARRECDGRISARLLALANALDGLPREEAARLAGMTGQTLGDWVHRYNEEGVEGLRDRPRSGRPCALDEGQQAGTRGKSPGSGGLIGLCRAAMEPICCGHVDAQEDQLCRAVAR